ncbi:peptidase inhibitor family I36 protein [Streptomyces sp. ActVer]|uniref:peptidase inhibitor family I36 protein n=1 Tax=Streptomyces sp. ActVer TaxID=3014558 RepID=UPI0022B35126|nr:peptidase inhibitor family I36 protein [Streptomyces sp. ActVer]MCZ4509100.1 peptidase inhibitor family I36 protein [Streptomyces sp. ActVer]
MKRRISVLLGLTMLMSVGTAGFMSATASAGETGTRATYLVLYDGQNFTGRQASFSGSDRDLRDKYWDGTTTVMDNMASSMRNNTQSSIRMWNTGGTCTGNSYSARPSSADASLDALGDSVSCVVFL